MDVDGGASYANLVPILVAPAPSQHGTESDEAARPLLPAMPDPRVVIVGLRPTFRNIPLAVSIIVVFEDEN